MEFEPGILVTPTHNPIGFRYGPGVYGPEPELRLLKNIRASLRDPDCEGPDPVYAIAMDVGKKVHRKMLHEQCLLFGVVTYAAGRLGREPVRSQGHVHAPSHPDGWSTPEVYEIWTGKAVVYMQERTSQDPGRCFAVKAGPGEVVVVPPGWAHATISADPQQPLTFGAWCVRDYAFDYKEVRTRKGLAWYPVLSDDPGIRWIRNEEYIPSGLVEKRPEIYAMLDLDYQKPIYAQYEEDPSRFGFVPRPRLKATAWKEFVP